MENVYLEYTFQVAPKVPATEILIAELGNVGFESFVENDNGVLAFIQQQEWCENILDDIYVINSGEFNISFSYREIKQVNWNEEWEKNFTPIEVDECVCIRAPFHEQSKLQYDIVIEPKMSFGTGHHETTHMMIQHLLALDLKNKTVLDMGCGTGILAIFAEMRGAKQVDAIDIDNWCYLNTLENIERNRCKNINAFEGDASLLLGKKYDLIIANINRNILLKDLKTYISCLNEKGMLLLSGFYIDDIPMINAKAKEYDLTLGKVIEKNNWVAVNFLK